MSAEDLTGQVFGKLTVLRRDGRIYGTHPAWLARCKCGSKRLVRTSTQSLKEGHTTSCGCHRLEVLLRGSAASVTHGASRKLREHHIWLNIKYRCNSQTCRQYPDYGGRGIKVCKRWEKFENFLADMGPAPSPLHTIDRKNNNGPYSPANCRWATRKEQANNRRNNTFFTHAGITMNGQAWAERLGLSVNTFWCRIKEGWTMERIVSTPWKGTRKGKAK